MRQSNLRPKFHRMGEICRFWPSPPRDILRAKNEQNQGLCPSRGYLPKSLIFGCFSRSAGPISTKQNAFDSPNVCTSWKVQCGHRMFLEGLENASIPIVDKPFLGSGNHVWLNRSFLGLGQALGPATGFTRRGILRGIGPCLWIENPFSRSRDIEPVHAISRGYFTW